MTIPATESLVEPSAMICMMFIRLLPSRINAQDFTNCGNDFRGVSLPGEDLVHIATIYEQAGLLRNDTDQPLLALAYSQKFRLYAQTEIGKFRIFHKKYLPPFISIDEYGFMYYNESATNQEVQSFVPSAPIIVHSYVPVKAKEHNFVLSMLCTKRRVQTCVLCMKELLTCVKGKVFPVAECVWTWDFLKALCQI